MTNYSETMLDLETLSVDSDAAIISLGAVHFNLEDNNTALDYLANSDGRIMYGVVRLDDAMKWGKTDASTLKWWLNQSEEARGIFKFGCPTEYLRTMLVYFNDFMKINNEQARNIWGNGSGFDCVVIENAYKKQQLEMTWRFTQQRDLRTIKDLAKRINPKVNNELDVGTRHNALDDAIKQVLLVQRYYRVIINKPIEGDLKNV
jgi:hypothetical protein